MAEFDESLDALLTPGPRASKPTNTVHCIKVDSEGQGTALRHIVAERKYQDTLWGQARDRDSMTEMLWLNLLEVYGRGTGRAEGYDFRTRMVKVAAIAVAAIEAFDGKQSRLPTTEV